MSYTRMRWRRMSYTQGTSLYTRYTRSYCAETSSANVTDRSSDRSDRSDRSWTCSRDPPFTEVSIPRNARTAAMIGIMCSITKSYNHWNMFCLPYSNSRVVFNRVESFYIIRTWRTGYFRQPPESCENNYVVSVWVPVLSLFPTEWRPQRISVETRLDVVTF